MPANTIKESEESNVAEKDNESLHQDQKEHLLDQKKKFLNYSVQKAPVIKKYKKYWR